MLRVKAWNRPAAFTSGAWKPPASRASSTSRGGTSARASTSAASAPRTEHPALDDEVRVRPGEVVQRLRRDHRVAVGRTKAIATGPSSSCGQLGEPGVLRRPGGPGCSCRSCTRWRRAQRGAQLGELRHRQPAVLGQHRGVRGPEPVRDVVDRPRPCARTWALSAGALVGMGDAPRGFCGCARGPRGWSRSPCFASSGGRSHPLARPLGARPEVFGVRIGG